MAAAVEGTTRLGLDRISKIQGRTAAEYYGARTIGVDGDTRRHILFVGNSLLDEGVKFERLRQALSADWDARRFVVENTFYYDWYYGVRRLFEEGARPDVVVVMLSTRQWVRSDIRGDYSAQYLMSTRDLPAVVRELHLHPTVATGLILANLSKFWGTRAEIRNFFLGRMMPDLGRLMGFSSVADARALPEQDVAAQAVGRIERLNDVVRTHGGHMIVVMPPFLAPDGSAGLLHAAADAGVPALRPVQSGTYGPEFYRDAGFHLNSSGAAAFTEELIPALRTALGALQSDAGGAVLPKGGND
jgi:hypothetical protein